MQTWVKLDDSLPLKLRRAGPEAWPLFTAALTHLSSELLGDVLPDADVSIVATLVGLTERKALHVLERIEQAGHAQRTEEGWRLIQGEIGPWARTKTDVEAMKEAKARAGRASAAAAKKRREAKQQAVQQGAQQGVGHEGARSEQQTRDVSLDYVERLTGSDEQEPVDEPDYERCAEGARSARAALKAVGE